MSFCAGPLPSRRLFDREPDNEHEEPLLLAQLAAREYRALLANTGGAAAHGAARAAVATAAERAGVDGVADASSSATGAASGGGAGAAVSMESAELLEAATCRLEQAASALDQQCHSASGDDGGGAWIGGLVHDPSAFPYLFRWLLALWAVPPVHVPCAVADALVRRLRRCLPALHSPELSGPMVAALRGVAEVWHVALPSAGSNDASPWSVLFLLDEGLCGHPDPYLKATGLGLA